MMRSIALVNILLAFISCLTVSNAFSPITSISGISSISKINLGVTKSNHETSTTSHPINMSTVVAPPEEKTKRKTGGGGSGNESDDRSVEPGDIAKYNDAPLEYLEDEWSTRNPEDPFHILLLDTTFTKSERVTIAYVSGCLTYVLGIPEEEATELTQFAATNGFSCLGTWEREECLKLGKQLQIRDLVVRVVPYCEGGMRGWQMRSADAGAGSSSGDFSYGSGFE